MTKTKKNCKRFAYATLFTVLLFAFSPASAQYMSFFGDSTWEYNITHISQPPTDYVNNPPDEPNQLGVYCVTFSYRFQKEHHADSNYWHGDCPAEAAYVSVSNNTVEGSLVDWTALITLYEDTLHGRLYQGEHKLICDMSLSEGDTFVLKNICNNPCVNNPGDYYPWDSSLNLSFDIYMLADSVRYINGRKVVFLSLIDHQDDYFSVPAVPASCPTIIFLSVLLKVSGRRMDFMNCVNTPSHLILLVSLLIIIFTHGYHYCSACTRMILWFIWFTRIWDASKPAWEIIPTFGKMCRHIHRRL